MNRTTCRDTTVLFLTRYSTMGASSRYRFLSYIPALEAAGITVKVSALFDDSYLSRKYTGRSAGWRTYMSAIASRLMSLRDVNQYAVVVIEKELFPYLPLFAEAALLPRSFVLDYDDAIFHQYDMHPNPAVRCLLRNKIRSLMHRSSHVIAGNKYLADFARQAGAAGITMIPTVVDLGKYPSAPRTAKETFTIGWIGTPTTAKYLHAVAPALAEVCANGRGKVVLIGAGELRLAGVPIEVVPWSERTEIAHLRSCDVGIMPLPDEPWERGKCGFKLIHYMAGWLPVIASPVGVNAEIVDSTNGFLVRGLSDWTKALRRLQESRELCRRMGAAGRLRVETRYSLNVTAPQMVSLLQSASELARRPHALTRASDSVRVPSDGAA